MVTLTTFNRKSKQNAGIINFDQSVIVSPRNGTITQYSSIDSKTLILAKQKTFTAQTLLAVKNTSFTDFIVVYLAPKDYHRVHMPLGWKINSNDLCPRKIILY